MKKPKRVRLVLLLVAAAACVELAARFGLGLGTPPLSVPHPEVEYLFAPDQDVQRFGNRQRYNAWSMRTPDFPRTRQDPTELRVLVIGDSVINGGNLTDEVDLATTLAAEELRRTLGRPVLIMNASAGSWGPKNQLAYLRGWGIFDADQVIVVLNSGDADDVPTFEPLCPDSYPQRAPLSATTELVTRYIWPRISAFASAFHATETPKDSQTRREEVSDDLVLDLTAMRSIAEASEAAFDVVVFPNRDEAGEGAWRRDGRTLLAALRAMGEEPRVMLPELSRNAEFFFRDRLHPNQEGQKLLAETIVELAFDAVHAAEQKCCCSL